METKICKKCGRELPISQFKNNCLSKDGTINICKDCYKKALRERKSKTEDITPPLTKGCNPELSQFTPRELIDELKARGYRGKLSIVRKVVL